MTRLVDAPVEVRGCQGPFRGPAGFRWRSRWYDVRCLLDVWTDTGAWWDGEEELTFFRLVAGEGTVFELLRDRHGAWRLYRIYD